MRLFGFNAPNERIAPEFWRAGMNYEHINTGRFVRNAVLDGKTYGGADLVPGFLKGCDLVHPMCGASNLAGEALSCYGGVKASAGVNEARSVVKPWNKDIWWTPGGTGEGAWLSVMLPEAGVAERYMVGSAQSCCPLSWRLEGSLDGETWTDVHVVENTGVWTAANEEKIYTVPEPTRGLYLWYRLYITASNVGTMKIWKLRLWRPQSECPRGALMFDASPARPLVMSFADGFGTDGNTPLDRIDSMGNGSIIPVVDDTGGSLLDGFVASPGGTMPVNIYAVRDMSGGVRIELEGSGAAYNPLPASGMPSQEWGGWVEVGYGAANPATGRHFKWGRTSSNAAYDKYTVSELSRAGRIPFYVGNLAVTIGITYQKTANVYSVELDNTNNLLWSGYYGGSASRPYSGTAKPDRLVLGLKVVTGEADFNYIGCINFTTLAPLSSYRFANGRMYQKDLLVFDAPWEAVQKIRVGSAVISGNDLYQVLPMSSQMLQFSTGGDVKPYLEP